MTTSPDLLAARLKAELAAQSRNSKPGPPTTPQPEGSTEMQQPYKVRQTAEQVIAARNVTPKPTAPTADPQRASGNISSPPDPQAVPEPFKGDTTL